MRADYDQSRELLDALPAASPLEAARADVLRAELARIGSDAEAWYAAAKRAVRSASTAGALLALAAAHAGGAAKRLGKDREAAKAFAAVDDMIVKEKTNQSIGRATFLLGVAAWEDGDYDRAERLANKNLSSRVNEAESFGLCGWVEVKRERFARAGAYFSSALDALSISGAVDERLRANLVHAGVLVATETIDMELGYRFRREFTAMEWRPALWEQRFGATTLLWQFALLEGDIEGAWAMARDGVAFAKTPAYRAMAEMNAAEMSRMIGDVNGAFLQLRRAWQILRTEQWSAADAAARVALTGFAIEGAQRMPAEARKAITMYQSLSGKANTLGSLERDRRVTAYETLAAARVSEATGNVERAMALYERSLAIWTELEFRMRAAIVALDLRRLTSDDAYLEHVEIALKRAPRAWFRHEAMADEGPLGHLTSAERGVLLELLQGKSTREIAEESDRSEYTVSNHTRKIFAAFEVHSRSRLLARCRELGITLESIERGTRPIAPVIAPNRR